VSCHHPSEDRVTHDISCRSILVSDRYRVFVEPHLSQSQKFLEFLSFFLFLHFVTFRSLSLSFFLIFLVSLSLSLNVAGCNPVFDGRRSTKTRSVSRDFSDTFTFQLCLASDGYFKEPLFAYRYVYILASMRIPLRSVRKFNDNLLFCILEYRRENELILIH